MAARALLPLLGVFHNANGLWAPVKPPVWFYTIPGASLTGPFNARLVRDVGMAFVASGAALAAGVCARRHASTLATAGATWPALHAMVHIAGWLTRGFPTKPDIVTAETRGVVRLALLGLFLSGSR